MTVSTFARLITPLCGIVLLASCGSVDSPDIDALDAANDTVDAAQAEPDDPAPSPTYPQDWQSLTSWDSGISLTADSTVLELGSFYECFNDECQDPLDYGRATHLTITRGADIRVSPGESSRTLQLVMRGQAGNLQFQRATRENATDASDGAPLSVVFDELGMFHVEIRSQLDFGPDTGETVVHKYAWVQVVDADSPCGENTRVAAFSGVTDRNGCPSSAARLNYVSLHPEFHCAPWPAVIKTAGGSGRFVRDSSNIDALPDGAQTIGAFAAGWEIYMVPESSDELYLQNSDGAIERWLPETDEMGCA